MRKIRKGYSLIVVLVMVGVFLGTKAGYAYFLRVPVGIGEDRTKPIFDKNNNPKDDDYDNLKQIHDLACSIDDKIKNIHLCYNRKIASMEDKIKEVHPQFREDEMFVSKEKEIVLTSELAHLLLSRLNEVIAMLSHAEEQKEALRHALFFYDMMETILALKDDDLILELLLSSEARSKLGYVAYREHMPEIENLEGVLKRARELLRIYRDEILYPEIRAIVQLCGENPNELLK